MIRASVSGRWIWDYDAFPSQFYDTCFEANPEWRESRRGLHGRPGDDNEAEEIII